MKNYAGRSDVDDELAAELLAAGIKIEKMPEMFRDGSGEVKTIIIGSLHGWAFRRSWRYWVAEGPGIEAKEAMDLHEVYGSEVRVNGHCGCPSPIEWFKGLACGYYHVDTQEGLKALAGTIKRIVEKAGAFKGSGE